MSITNQDILDNAGTTYRDMFDEIFVGRAPGFYEAFTEVIPTDSKINEIDVLEAMPQIREWVDEKVFRDIFASALTATVKPHEKSTDFKRIDIITDRSGKIARRLRAFLSAGGDGGSIYDFLATAALVANGLCYDGQNLFSTTHPRGPNGATQSNLTTVAGGLKFSSHETVMTAGASLRDAENESMNIAYNVMMVGPSQKATAQEITQSRERVIGVDASGTEATSSVVAAASAPNVYAGGDLMLVINPRLVGDYASETYYFDTTKGDAKAVIGFELTPPHAEEQFSMDDHIRFHKDKLAASVECDVVFAPGAWMTAHKLVPS